MKLEAQIVTADEQLELWVQGKSVHRAVGGHGRLERSGSSWYCPGCGAEGPLEALRAGNCLLGNYECCPDFSCCYPSLQESLEERKLYALWVRANKNVTCTGCGKLIESFLELKEHGIETCARKTGGDV